MTVRQRKDWQIMQRSTLTYSIEHMVLESRVSYNDYSLVGIWKYHFYDYQIKVEILNIQIIRSTAQLQTESVKSR